MNDKQPEFLSISQASKISGIAKSSIIHHIKNGLYGDVKEAKQGNRPVKQISTEKFLAACKDQEIEVDWTAIERSKKRSVNRTLNDQKPINNNELQATVKALEEQYQARLAEKDKELQRALKSIDEANERAENERLQAAAEREKAHQERQQLNDARNFFEAQRNFMLGRIEGLGRGDGLKLLLGKKIDLSLPAPKESKEQADKEIIDAEAEEVFEAEKA